MFHYVISKKVFIPFKCFLNCVHGIKCHLKDTNTINIRCTRDTINERGPNLIVIGSQFNSSRNLI